MIAATITLGALLCYPAALPSATDRIIVRVRIVQLAPLASGRPGVWVNVEDGKLAGIQWLVPLAELQECGT